MALGRKILFDDNDNERLEKGSSLGRKIEFSEKQISRLRSLASALPKGIAKGIFELGQMAVPLAFEDEPFEERQKTIARSLKAKEKAEKGLEETLPTRDEFIENALERGGKILPSATLGPGGAISTIGRSLLAGGLGETVKEAGGGELAQTGAEVAAFGLPSLGRKIIPTKSQEKLVNYARKTGLSEKEIAPLIPGKQKQAFFGKIASKGDKTQAALKQTRQGIGNAYDFVSSQPSASKTLSTSVAQKYMEDSAKIAYQMPHEIRKQVFEDAKDLINQGFTGKNLINFYQDIGSKYKIGREQLERLKGPIVEALESLSPELAEDFKLTNELFKKRILIGKTLKPGISSELMDLGELGKLAHSVLNMSVKGLSQFLGMSGARRLAREMLINPRLQNITKQMAVAANKGKFPIVMRLAEYLRKRYEDEQSVEEISESAI